MGESAQGTSSPVERKRISRGWIIGLSVAGAGLLVMVAAVVAGVWLLFGFGADMYADMIRRDIQDNPVIVEKIGVIQEIELDFVATANENHPEVFVFRLRGAHGAGELTARCVTQDDATEKVVAGMLRTASGERLELFPGQPANPF